MKCNRNRNGLHYQFNRNPRLRSRLNLEIFTLHHCDEPRLWWLGFLLYHRLSWLCFRRDYSPVCVR